MLPIWVYGFPLDPLRRTARRCGPAMRSGVGLRVVRRERRLSICSSAAGVPISTSKPAGPTTAGIGRSARSCPPICRLIGHAPQCRRPVPAMTRRSRARASAAGTGTRRSDCRRCSGSLLRGRADRNRDREMQFHGFRPPCGAWRAKKYRWRMSRPPVAGIPASPWPSFSVTAEFGTLPNKALLSLWPSPP